MALFNTLEDTLRKRRQERVADYQSVMAANARAASTPQEQAGAGIGNLLGALAIKYFGKDVQPTAQDLAAEQARKGLFSTPRQNVMSADGGMTTEQTKMSPIEELNFRADKFLNYGRQYGDENAFNMGLKFKQMALNEVQNQRELAISLATKKAAADKGTYGTAQRWVDSEGNYYLVQADASGANKVSAMAGSPAEPVGKLSPVGTSGDTGSVDYQQQLEIAELKANLDKGKEGFKRGADYFFTRFEDARLVNNNLPLIDEQIALLESGDVATGPFSKAAVLFDSLLKEAGLSSGDVAAATQEYSAKAGGLTAQVIKNFGSGTGLSDADRQYAANMVAGDPSLQKQGLIGILKAMKAASERSLGNFNKYVNRRTAGFMENVGMGKDEVYFGTYGLPNATQGSTQPQVVNWNDLP